MNLELDGIAPLINRLEKFDKDVSKELKKQMRQASQPLIREARASYPQVGLTNWGPWTQASRGRDLSYDVGTVRKNVKLKQTRRRVRGATVAFGYSAISSNAGGAIIELAGKKSTDRFSQALVNRHGPVGRTPRFITQAYYAVGPKVRQDIESFVERAMRKVGL